MFLIGVIFFTAIFYYYKKENENFEMEKCVREQERRKKEETELGIKSACYNTFRGMSRILEGYTDPESILINLYRCVTSKYCCNSFILSDKQKEVVEKIISRTGMTREEFIVWLVNKYSCLEYCPYLYICRYDGKYYIELNAFNGISYIVRTKKVLIELKSDVAIQSVKNHIVGYINYYHGEFEEAIAKTEQYVKENIKAYTFFQTTDRSIDELLEQYQEHETFTAFYGSPEWKDYKYDSSCATYMTSL